MSEVVVILLIVAIYFIPIVSKGRISVNAQILFQAFLLLFWIAITIIDPVNVYFSIAIGLMIMGTLLRKMVLEGFIHHKIWRVLAFGLKSGDWTSQKSV